MEKARKYANAKRAKGSNCHLGSTGVEDQYNYSERPQDISRQKQRLVPLLFLVKRGHCCEQSKSPPTKSRKACILSYGSLSSLCNFHVPPADQDQYPLQSTERQTERDQRNRRPAFCISSSFSHQSHPTTAKRRLYSRSSQSTNCTSHQTAAAD